jgi:hypothetical protein
MVFYVVFLLFFGSIAVKGYRAYVSPWIKLGIRIAFGFLSLIGGLALADFFPYLKGGIYELMQADVIVMGVIISALFGVSLYLVSCRIPKAIILKQKLMKLEEELKKVKDEPSPVPKRFDSFKIAGIALIVIIIIVSFVNFRGFPDPGEGLYSFLGITEEEFNDILNRIQDIQEGVKTPEGCENNLNLLTEFGTQIASLEPYTDDDMKTFIEGQSSKTIVLMYNVSYNQKEIIMAFSDDNFFCSVTEGRFCECVDLEALAG